MASIRASISKGGTDLTANIEIRLIDQTRKANGGSKRPANEALRNAAQHNGITDRCISSESPTASSSVRKQIPARKGHPGSWMAFFGGGETIDFLFKCCIA